MALIFGPISSPGGTRDLFVDLTGALEDDEILTFAAVTSVSPGVLTISNVATNSSVFDVDGQQVAIGKGVHFTIQTLQESSTVVPLILSFEGDGGTEDKYELAQPVVINLCS